ncbi:MAG: ribonuclease III domain-containing protein [Methanoregula sp.]|nr:ribonuclease III domain-containing protein [Methanoregula sp.]
MAPLKIRELQKKLGYKFKVRKHLVRALTHPTFSEEERKKKVDPRECPHQQAYSTLGDAVLKTGLILLLMDKKKKTKGDITISKADLENNLKLAVVGKRLQLLENELILHTIKNQKKLEEASEKICADTVEAIIAAIFIDSKYSMKKTQKCIQKIFAQELAELEKLP